MTTEHEAWVDRSQRVIARGGNATLRRIGKVIAYRPQPSVLIESDDGEREWWPAALCEETVPADGVTDDQVRQLLNTAMDPDIGGTVRGYLVALLAAFWSGEASPKYGMTGASDWRYDLYEPMRRLGLVPGWQDGYGIEYPPGTSSFAAATANGDPERRRVADGIIARAIGALS